MVIRQSPAFPDMKAAAAPHKPHPTPSIKAKASIIVLLDYLGELAATGRLRQAGIEYRKHGVFVRHHVQRERDRDRTVFFRIPCDRVCYPNSPPLNLGGSLAHMSIVERDSLAESLTTQVLIEQIQQGDRAALESLYNRYQTRVLAAVRIRLGAKLRRKVESCDIVQQVMLEALGKVNSFDFRTDGAFLNYLNRVVENRIRDEADRWRAKRRDMNREVSIDAPRSSGSADPLDIPGTASPTPSNLLSLEEDLARLEVAMDRLGDESEEYCELIVAVKIEGQTYAELAQEHGGSPDAVRMKVRRAQAALARIYKELDAES